MSIRYRQHTIDRLPASAANHCWPTSTWPDIWLDSRTIQAPPAWDARATSAAAWTISPGIRDSESYAAARSARSPLVRRWSPTVSSCRWNGGEMWTCCKANIKIKPIYILFLLLFLIEILYIRYLFYKFISINNLALTTALDPVWCRLCPRVPYPAARRAETAPEFRQSSWGCNVWNA